MLLAWVYLILGRIGWCHGFILDLWRWQRVDVLRLSQVLLEREVALSLIFRKWTVHVVVPVITEVNSATVTKVPHKAYGTAVVQDRYNLSGIEAVVYVLT